MENVVDGDKGVTKSGPYTVSSLPTMIFWGMEMDVRA